jgi:hypothetical protein
LKIRTLAFALIGILSIAGSAFAGSCVAYRTTPQRPKTPETLIIARNVEVRTGEKERKFISNDQRLVLVFRQLRTETRPNMPAGSAVYVGLELDGKELLVSESVTSDGNALMTRASAATADGSTWGMTCSAIDY